MSSTSALEPALRYDEPGGTQHWRRRRTLYIVFTISVSIITGAAVVEAIGGLALYGVDTQQAHAEANGYELRVNYPRVTRGQLDSPLRFEVRHPGGFDSDVTIQVTADYLDLFTENAVSPEPSEETRTDESFSMTFDPPSGDTLSVVLQLVARPRGGFASVPATVAVVDEDGNPAVSVDVRTDLRP